MQITVLVVEDNPITAQDLKETLEGHGFLVQGIAKIKEEALDLIKENEPDILLVDINLTVEDEGIVLVKELRTFSSIPVIYLTAYTDKGLVDRALKTKPAAYLTKPYDEKDVTIAIELAFFNHWNNLISMPSSPITSFIFLRDGEVFTKVELEEILYLQAEGSYTKFVTTERNYTLSGNLNSVMGKIENDAFVRIHRSHIINIHKVTGMDNNHVFLNDITLSIGRNYKDEVGKFLKKIS